MTTCTAGGCNYVAQVCCYLDGRYYCFPHFLIRINGGEEPQTAKEPKKPKKPRERRPRKEKVIEHKDPFNRNRWLLTAEE